MSDNAAYDISVQPCSLNFKLKSPPKRRGIFSHSPKETLNFSIFARPIQPREARQRTETLARRAKNWRGKPLDSLATIINLVETTKTQTGLFVKAMLDDTIYEEGIKVSDAELALVNLTHDDFHGEWNYMIAPQHA